MMPLSIGLWAALSAYCAEIPGAPSPIRFSCAYTAIAVVIGSLRIFTAHRIPANRTYAEL